MPINPNIAMSYRAPDIQPQNMLADYAAIQQIQGGRQAQELNALKMQQAQKEMQSQNVLGQAYAQATDPVTGKIDYNKLTGLVAAGGGGAQLPGIEKTRREVETAALTQQETGFKVQKAKKDFVAQAQRDTSQNPSDANITAYKEDLIANPLFSEAEKKQMIAGADRLLSMPVEQRRTIMSSQGASASELAPKLSVGPTGIVQTPAFGGPATVVPGTSAAFQMTPAQLEQARRDQQRLGLEGQRVGLERERVGIARTEAERKAAGGDLKPVPVHAQKAITGAASSVNKLTDAIDLLSGLKVAGQEGSATATGIKGYAPDIALNRLDPKGTVTRAAIADIGSMIMHDRSGAAVTASESPRLKPFIPLITDSVDTAKKKLERLRQIQLDEAEALTGTYNPEQGFKLFTAPLKGGKSAAPAAPYSNMSNEELLKQLSGGK